MKDDNKATSPLTCQHQKTLYLAMKRLFIIPQQQKPPCMHDDCYVNNRLVNNVKDD
jgi:hypothetical protein